MLVCWVVRLFGWLVGWLVGWFIGWFDYFVRCLFAILIGQFGWFLDCSPLCLFFGLAVGGWLGSIIIVGWLVGVLVEWLSG